MQLALDTASWDIGLDGSGKNGDFTAVDLGYQTCEIGELDF